MSQNHRIFGETLGLHGPLWVVSRYDTYGDARLGWLTFELHGMGTILPIFSSGDDAKTFLRGTYHGGERYALEASQAGRVQLTAELLDPLTEIERVAFDPLPEPDLRHTVELASLSRTAFVDLVLGRGRAWSARGDRGGVVRA